MGSLGKRIKRELVKSPAKGAVLGLVCLIALWYWAPILKDWLTGASDTPPDIRVVKSEENDGTDSRPITTAVENPGKRLSTVCNWQTLVKWLNEDPMAEPATLPEDHRDPFRRAETKMAEDLIREMQEEAEEESTNLVAQPQTPVRQEPDFSDLNLVLGGTMVGRHSRSATINGKTYLLRNDASRNREGQRIRIPIGANSATNTEANGQTITLELVQVHPDHVVLELQGEEHRLELDRPRLAIGNQIIRHATVERIDTGDDGQNESTGNAGLLQSVFHWFNGDM
jgi:hypothetical protein